jgi:hypothetical protein
MKKSSCHGSGISQLLQVKGEEKYRYRGTMLLLSSPSSEVLG